MKKAISCGCGCAPLIIGSIFVVAAVILGLFVGGIFSLTCQRQPDGAGVCVYKKKSFCSIEQKKIPIADIKKVYLKETKFDDEDDGTITYVYNVKIDTKSETISFTPYASGDKEPKVNMVDNINTFLNDKSQQKLYVEQNDEHLGITLALVFGIIGIVLIVVSIGLIVVVNFYQSFYSRL